MRILHIMNELKPSGAEVMLRSAASQWMNQGISGAVLATGESAGQYATALETAGFSVLHIPFARSPHFLWRVYRLLRTERFDGVHIHTERANFWYALIARLAGVRRIFRTVHSTYPYAGRTRAAHRVQRWCLRRCLHVETLSIGPSVYRNELERLGNPTTIVPNWFDSEAVRPAQVEEHRRSRVELGISDDHLVIASVGNCSDVKNHAAIIEALTRIGAEVPLTYLHAGREEAHGPEQELARRCGVADRIRFLGAVQNVVPILHAADAFVMPSRYEGFGVAAVEAMAAGLPVILSDVPGLKDFAEAPPAIWWVAPEPESVAAAIRALAALPGPDRTRRGAALAAWARTRFGLHNGAATYARLYLEGRC